MTKIKIRDIIFFITVLLFTICIHENMVKVPIAEVIGG